MTEADSTYLELWRTLSHQATIWSTTPAVQRFARELPRNAGQRSSGLPGLLQSLQAGGAHVDGQPFRLVSLVPFFMQLPGRDADVDAEELNEWLAVGRRVEWAHRGTIAWIRSRLPGYPSIPTPHLVADSPLTTVEYTDRLTWAPRERRLGFQFKAEPPGVGEALDASPENKRLLANAARAVVRAFSRTPEWEQLSESRQSLDDAAIAELNEARRQLKDRLRPENVDEFEPNLAMRRSQYREEALRRSIDGLSGRAREFADAFEAVDRQIERCASDAFSQLVLHAEFPLIEAPTDIELLPGPPQRVGFTAEEDLWPYPAIVVWIRDNHVRDAVYVESVNWTMNIASGADHRIQGTILDGTYRALRGS